MGASLAEAFERYDGDGKGALNPTELQQALEDLELPSGETEVASLFKRLDTNKDGVVDLQEWLENLPKGTRISIKDKPNEKGSLLKWALPEVKIVYTHTDEAPMLASPGRQIRAHF